MAVPTAAGQTFDLLSNAIVEYADNRDIITTTGSQLYSNQVITAPITSSHLSEDQLLNIVKLVAAAVHTGHAKINKPTRAQVIHKSYCWTHGYGGHSGTQCLRPGAGHIESATKESTQGGSTKGRGSF
jgi:hypothetical protein